MDKKLQSDLKIAIYESLSTLKRLLASLPLEKTKAWSKQVDDSWNCTYQLKPSIDEVLLAAENQLNENGRLFTEKFFENHSEYNQFVNCWFTGCDFSHNQTLIFKAVIRRLWERYGTFDCDELAVSSIVEEVIQFVNEKRIRYRFQAVLLNFSMTEQTLVLPNALTIRRLKDQELSTFYNEPLVMPGINTSFPFGIHEFVIEGEDEIPMIYGNPLSESEITSPLEKITLLLDRAVLCLRTFKSDPIGYSFIHSKPLNFCPFLSDFGSTRFNNRHDMYIPFGRYELLDDEKIRFYEYAVCVLKTSESAMNMALSRLADAEIRIRPQDKILDAVIGMEALLLAGLRNEDRRGELKYRFSLHFSTLEHSPQDRYNAFRLAKDLYDLRSSIAHGGSQSNDVRIGQEKLSLPEASNRAIEALRKVIRWFLPKVESAPYKKPEYWEQAYFNLDANNSNS
jgi:Apea-like HEPN